VARPVVTILEFLVMKKKDVQEEYSDEEIARRRDELAKRMLNMPPQPLKPKSKDGTKASHPKKRGRTVKTKSLGSDFQNN
jgi:hypothetical protein